MVVPIQKSFPSTVNAGSSFTLIFIVPVAWIALANNVKRFHDLGKSGWWVLGLCIPIVNLLIAIYLGFFKGEECDNQYGPDPYE